MGTHELITLSALGLLWVVFYFLTGYAIDNKSNRHNMMKFFGFCMVNAFFIMIAIIQTAQVNELRQKVKNKCPELEKIENVYQIKQ